MTGAYYLGGAGRTRGNTVLVFFNFQWPISQNVLNLD